MNIFILDKDPVLAAQMYCDKHLPKMVIELYQQLGSAVLRHGAKEQDMPLTQKGTPLKASYTNHPCTLWVGENRANFDWAMAHAKALCQEYSYRFAREHACLSGIEQLTKLEQLLPTGLQTEFPQVMPAEFQGRDPVAAYRQYYHSKNFANWRRGRAAPDWWRSNSQIAKKR